MLLVLAGGSCAHGKGGRWPPPLHCSSTGRRGGGGGCGGGGGGSPSRELLPVEEGAGGPALGYGAGVAGVGGSLRWWRCTMVVEVHHGGGGAPSWWNRQTMEVC